MVKHSVDDGIIAGSGKMHFGNYDHGKSIQTAGDKAAKRAYEKGLTRREEDDERNCEISDGGKIERHLVISHDLADFPAQEPNSHRYQQDFSQNGARFSNGQPKDDFRDQ